MTIKELRKQKKLTQAAFAKAIGVGLSTVGGYEAGRIQPSEAVIARIKEVYGADIGAASKPAKAAPKKEKAPAPKKEAKASAPKKEAKAPAPVKEAKAPAPKKETKPAAAKKASARKPRAKKPAEPVFIIQSPLGGEITPFAVLAKVGEVDKVYIRVDLNKAFWVKGNETGSVDLW